MENQDIIEYVAKELKNKTYYTSITDYLVSKNIPENEHDAIFKKARELLFEEKIPGIRQKNIQIFIFFIVSTLLTFLFFYSYLPKIVESDSVILSIIGSVITIGFALFAFKYYKSWEPENIKILQKANFDYGGLLVIGFIPVGIVAIIFYFHFSNVADEILKQNYIEVVGKITSGYERTTGTLRRQIKSSNVLVEFKTIEGKEMTVNVEISESEFNNFYIDQEVPLIYSKTNPLNVKLLTNEHIIKEYLNSEEVSITIPDLEKLINIPKSKIETTLNKYSYGWKYNNQQQAWINERKNIAIAFKENQLNYLTNIGEINSNMLKENGYKPLDNKFDNNPLIPKPLYTKKGYTIALKSVSSENQTPMLLATISKQ